MAEVIRTTGKRSRKISDRGYSGILETIVASQREGCNRLSARILTLNPGGHTPMLENQGETVCLVIEGELVLVDGDGFLHALSPGDAAIIRPHEKYILRNDTDNAARILAVSPV